LKKRRINMAFLRLLCVCLVLAMSWPLSAGALEVRFQDSVQAQGEMLTLGEIASLTPESSGQKHADIPLFRAPQEGEIQVYQAATLKAYVRDALPGEAEIAWAGAEEVTVRREGKLIQGEEVAEIVQQYLRNKARELPVKDLAFTPDSLPDPFAIPQGKQEHTVIPSHEDVVGSRYFTVRFRVDGKLAGNVTVRGQLEATAPVVVASRDLKRRTVLSREDLEVRESEISRSGRPLTSREKAVGMRLQRSVDSGEILQARKLERPVLVQRGEVVTMEASKGSLLLTAKGVARSRGKKGETIKVRNTGSEREILCKVVDSGRVRVEF